MSNIVIFIKKKFEFHDNFLQDCSLGLETNTSLVIFFENPFLAQIMGNIVIFIKKKVGVL